MQNNRRFESKYAFYPGREQRRAATAQRWALLLLVMLVLMFSCQRDGSEWIVLILQLLVISLLGFFSIFREAERVPEPCSSLTLSFTKPTLTAALSRTADYLGVNLRGLTSFTCSLFSAHPFLCNRRTPPPLLPSRSEVCMPAVR